ncbi:MAG: hypothetical protein SFY70_08335 [Bacteroidia bacterium]|nr:hypothetical protein [Bacteroidia bacterium]
MRAISLATILIIFFCLNTLSQVPESIFSTTTSIDVLKMNYRPGNYVGALSAISSLVTDGYTSTRLSNKKHLEIAEIVLWIVKNSNINNHESYFNVRHIFKFNIKGGASVLVITGDGQSNLVYINSIPYNISSEIKASILNLELNY